MMRKHSVDQLQVSVLMPVYNAAETLHECVESILAQTLTDFEIVVVDDFSDDDSIAILNASNDERIKVIKNTRKGIVHALNLGLDACQSDFVARMDADDIMHEERLSKQFHYMCAREELSLCATQAKKFPENLIKTGYVEYMRWQNNCLSMQDIRNQIYIESPFAHPSVMFRRQKIQALGGYRNGDFSEDYELWLRLYHAGEGMHKIEEELLYWRESAERLSRTSTRYSDSAFNNIRAEYLAKDTRLQNRGIVCWGAGRKTRQRVQCLIDLGIVPVAWIDIDNKKIGKSYCGAVVHSPEWLKQQQSKPLVLNYVRNHGARDKCRQYLEKAGYGMGRDYIDVA